MRQRMQLIRLNKTNSFLFEWKGGCMGGGLIEIEDVKIEGEDARFQDLMWEDTRGTKIEFRVCCLDVTLIADIGITDVMFGYETVNVIGISSANVEVRDITNEFDAKLFEELKGIFMPYLI